MGRDTFDIRSPPFDGDDILGLLETLRRDGFAIGIDEFLDARAILDACLSFNLNNKTSLRNWLAPVLCTNREEQRLFYQRFERWWAELAHVEDDSQDESELVANTRIDQEVVKPGWRSWLPNVAVATFVLITVWVGVRIYNDWKDSKDTPSVVPVVIEDKCPSALPDVKGIAESAAKRAINSAGLEVGDTANEFSDSVADGSVISAVWSADKGRECLFVNFIVSEGPDSEPEKDIIPEVVYRIELTGYVLDNDGDAVSNAIVVIAPGRYFGPVEDATGQSETFADELVEILEDRSPFLPGFVGTTTLAGHGSPVWQAVFSPDGARVVTASGDNSARVWSADPVATWSSQELVGHTDAVSDAAFSPDSARVVTASADNTARVWSTNANGAWSSQELVGHTNEVTHAVFSSGGTRVVTASLDRTARVWSTDADGEWSSQELAGHTDGVENATFSPDGAQVVTASRDRTARVWSAGASGAWSSQELVGHKLGVNDAMFSPDGARVVTASGDNTARVWSVEVNGAWSSQELAGHDDRVWQAVFSPDGARVATASADNTARVWSVDANGAWSSQELAGHTAGVWAVEFSPDGAQVVTASADNTARVWSVNAAGGWSSQELAGHTDDVGGAAFSPDGTRVVTASEDWAAQVWEKGNALDVDQWVRTSDNGSFKISTDHLDDAALVIKHSDHKTALGRRVLTDPGSVEIEATMIPMGKAWTRQLRDFESYIRGVLTLLPLFLAFAWWYRNRRLRNIVLEHRSSRNITSLAAVDIVEPPHELYRNAEFAHARTRVYSREERGSGVLDADETVERTVRRLGYFTPVYQSRLQLPNYLALIDRASFGDQQAELLGEFIDRLVEGGVSVERYYFDRDPRVCAAAPEVGINQRTLAELAARYPGYRLMIFSDGRGLSHPFTGGRASWLGLLDAWKVRVLMTSVPVYHWSQRELDLAASGLLVLPATQEGLLLFADYIHGQSATQQPAENWEPAYPEIIEAHPSRWLERTPPTLQDVEELLRQLYSYLDDDAFRWLCALAVYPELKWHITLYLGLELKRQDGKPILAEATLLKLTRLPWLRHGAIPDWLREQLIGRLSSADETSVRRFLRRLIRDPLEDAGSRFQLNIARPGEDLKPRHWSQFFTQLLASEPDDSPLRDAVFIQFLRGKRAGRLQFQAPSQWSRLLFRKGMRSLGVKTAVAWFAALLVSTAIWLTTGPSIEFLNKWLSPPGSSTIKALSQTIDGSILERFSTRGPGYTLADDSGEIFEGEGYTVTRCLRACESGEHDECVAAMVTDGGACKLFESYTGFVETNAQGISVYVKVYLEQPDIKQETANQLPLGPEQINLQDVKSKEVGKEPIDNQNSSLKDGDILQETGNDLLPSDQTIQSGDLMPQQQTGYDEPEPLDEGLAERLRNSVAVVRFSDSDQGFAQSVRKKYISPKQSSEVGVNTQASAFFVSEDGLMFTAAFDQDAVSASVDLPSNRGGIRTTTVTQNEKIMMAAIAVDGFLGDVTAIEMGETDPAQGDTVYLPGYASGQQWPIQSGRITGRSSSRSTGLPLLATDIRTQRGFSGAPVVDRNGQLVGMVASETESGMVLIIPVSIILDFRNEVSRQLRPRG